MTALALTAPALHELRADADDAHSAAPDFASEVRPILAKNCFACHGPDEQQRQAGLRLDDRQIATGELESGSVAVVPGDAEASELFRRITTEDELLRMPPPDAGERLTNEQIALIRRWIDAGAPYAGHWAFTPPSRPRPPPVDDAARLRNPIDKFIQARLEREKLSPAPGADRYTLIRRLSLDLRGLPPAPQEVRQFIDDDAPHAYERLVDRFLADPAFGERWARLWLDLARYADSKGYGSDPLRTIWLYRDWVIDAFNANLPYNRFTIDQLAGDLLPDPTQEQLIATAFHRNTMTNTEGGTDDEEFRVAAVKDRVDTTLQVWMGLTMGCAKCHSHKYDPISQREYYGFFDFFNHTSDADRPDESPTIEVAPTEVLAEAHRIESEIAELKKQLEAAEAKSDKNSDEKTSAAGEQPGAAEQVEEIDVEALREQIKQLETAKPQIPTVPVMRELPADERRATHVMVKGNFLQTGEKVEAGVPGAFHDIPADAPRNRLGVARWLVDPDNPLTARVAVNRFWGRLFGKGLVESEEDFGTQGEPPSHPELLDWLATEFVRSGWDVKRMLRLMVTSATYRQSSRVLSAHLQKDPRNRLLARAPRYRLEAEMVRDQALALSGLLSRKMHGPSVFPPQPEGLWRAAFNSRDRNWPTSTGVDRYRRGLYTFWRRTVPYPSMAVFDAPSREICTLRRSNTNTPLQAFVTLNDPAFVEAAQALARRIVREGGATAEERARFGLELCLARPAEPAQIAELTALVRSEREHYAANPQAAEALASDPLGPLPEEMSPPELAAWTVVAGVLLNLDGVLTKG